MVYESYLSPVIVEKLKKITLLVMDIDGTMTDGMLYYSNELGQYMKSFYVRDGMGITLLQQYGIQTAIITASQDLSIQKRAQHLNINHLILGSKSKKRDLIELAESLFLPLEHIAYIGDDVNDDLVMSISGISFCPNNAHPIILSRADCVCPFPGGKGAVRFACDLILESQGHSLIIQDDWK